MVIRKTQSLQQPGIATAIIIIININNSNSQSLCEDNQTQPSLILPPEPMTKVWCLPNCMDHQIMWTIPDPSH